MKWDVLEDVLFEANATKQILRVSFSDGEILDFEGFHIYQDYDHEYARCDSTLVRPVKFEEERVKFRRPGAALVFHLPDVIEVRDANSNELLFSLPDGEKVA